jgi:hypothetical protein
METTKKFILTSISQWAIDRELIAAPSYRSYLRHHMSNTKQQKETEERNQTADGRARS